SAIAPWGSHGERVSAGRPAGRADLGRGDGRVPRRVGGHRTRRNYAGTLRALAGRFELGAPLATLEDPDVAMALAAWFTDRWGKTAAATFNRNLDALRSAVRFWMGQGWLADDPTSGLRRRRRAGDRTMA